MLVNGLKKNTTPWSGIHFKTDFYANMGETSWQYWEIYIYVLMTEQISKTSMELRKWTLRQNSLVMRSEWLMLVIMAFPHYTSHAADFSYDWIMKEFVQTDLMISSTLLFSLCCTCQVGTIYIIPSISCSSHPLESQEVSQKKWKHLCSCAGPLKSHVMVESNGKVCTCECPCHCANKSSNVTLINLTILTGHWQCNISIEFGFNGTERWTLADVDVFAFQEILYY